MNKGNRLSVGNRLKDWPIFSNTHTKQKQISEDVLKAETFATFTDSLLHKISCKFITKEALAQVFFYYFRQIF